MGMIKILAGTVRIRVESADISALLGLMMDEEIYLENVTHIDEITAELSVPARDFRCAERIIRKANAQIHILARNGLWFSLTGVAYRPILVICIGVLLALSFLIPSKILFIEVEGNHLLTDRQIIQHAEMVGLRFGTPRSALRSEKIKNALLEVMPQLQWVGVNTRGCVAVITAKEREMEATKLIESPVSHVVASHDGVVQSVTASKGTVRCEIGQAVEEGQILISGYTDCGLAIKAQRAEGEIYAITTRDLSTITPLEYTQRVDILNTDTNYRLILGKKQINLWKDSGISGTRCVKMYEERYLTLPGGFSLPVGVSIEHLYNYHTLNHIAAAEKKNARLEKWNEEYLGSHIICGQILSVDSLAREEEGVLCVNAKYECSEMIGHNRDEEFIDNYGKDRREDR